jgi:hypothetical protein
MKRDRRCDEIIIASIMNEFCMPRAIRAVWAWKRPLAAFLAGAEGDPEACQRIIPRLEAEYGRRLVREAWRRWCCWRCENDKARARYVRCCGDGPLSDGEPSSDEEKAAEAELQAAVRHARRWLPLDDSEPLDT